MWWFGAMHRNLLMLANRLPLDTVDRPILDAGCGTGGFLVRLARSYPRKGLLGLDIDPLAFARAAVKSARPVCVGSPNELPFADGTFAAIFSADVLCHDGVNEHYALQQFHRCLAKDGWLVLNLPAYRWMLSRHDAAVYNVRRYTASGLSRLLQETGFRPVYLTYWNAMLFPFMAIARKVIVANTRKESDVKDYPPLIDLLCRWTTGIETALLRRGARFPFGGSLLAIATKRYLP